MFCLCLCHTDLFGGAFGEHYGVNEFIEDILNNSYEVNNDYDFILPVILFSIQNMEPKL